MIPCSIVLVGFLEFKTFGTCLVSTCFTTFTKVSILGCQKWGSFTLQMPTALKKSNIETWKWFGTGRACLKIMISILFVSFALQDSKAPKPPFEWFNVWFSSAFYGKWTICRRYPWNEPDISDNQLRTVQKMMWRFSKIRVPQKTIG